ncbi:MAG: hypothetical protein K8S94_06850 [Planctomycetia bacterium]|nr:hypothetical protein [Planctomycetia bacterium]
MPASTPVDLRSGVALATVALVSAVVGLVAGSWRSAAPLPRAAAVTSLSHESFAVCTAPIDTSVEGFFLLDFETGDLTGGVLNPATSKFGVSYRHNVLKDLGFKPGKVKNPKFLLVPGQASFTAGAGRMALSALYVTDAATGVTVAYGIPWNSTQTPAGGGGTVLELLPLDIAKPRGGGAKVQ